MHDATEDIEIIKRHFSRAWDKAHKVSTTWTNQKQRILVNELMNLCEMASSKIVEYGED